MQFWGPIIIGNKKLLSCSGYPYASSCQVWIPYETYGRKRILGKLKSYSVVYPHGDHLSSHTGQLDYAFEFFWPKSRNHLALMEDLLLTLREYLPSFKYVLGAQLGDELLVVDVENSSSGSGSGSTSVKIFPGNKLSTTPKKIEETRALAGMKRKSIEGQSELNQANQFPLTNINNPKGEDDDVVVDEDDDLVILAVYKVDYSLLFFPSSTTFENVMERINQEFELNPAGNYQVLPGEW
ncbi:hypothetical protein L1987_81214 [Smallanthus sonchifolius]|uniref:Uncharacterized protein n=1 Tax=Smallanthus sonchifolius TaxID=185202 RepID=A0ACB8YP62_9ASTR|nr:hypothetical protein L1987_81214 [Smallanthus sonchifolius]